MKLVFATHNQNKVKEVQEIFPTHITLLSLNDIDCAEDIPETAYTLEGNAILKADYVFKKYGYPCFADDTGLLVDALNGAPGVYSARYAGEQRDAEDNMFKLLEELKGNAKRTARFETVIALNLNDEQHLFRGEVQGEITTKKSGQKGFGYDPIFKPKGYDQTFAELPLTIKNRIGHRGKAINQLITYLNSLSYATS
jgi:XTP/dITP diphosphohydrolase